LLAHALHSTESNSGLPPRFLGRHAGLHIFFDLLLKMKSHFLIHFRVALTSDKEA
jgi:hypothetical protein